MAGELPTHIERAIPDEIDNSTAKAALHASWDGLVVPIASGLSMSDAVDPAQTSTPVQDAVDAIEDTAGSNGTVLLPFAPAGSGISETGPVTIDTNNKVSIIGHGGHASSISITGTGASAHGLSFTGDNKFANIGNFTIEGAGFGTAQGAAIHTDADFHNNWMLPIRVDTWGGPAVRHDGTNGNPFNNIWNHPRFATNPAASAASDAIMDYSGITGNSVSEVFINGFWKADGNISGAAGYSKGFNLASTEGDYTFVGGQFVDRIDQVIDHNDGRVVLTGTVNFELDHSAGTNPSAIGSTSNTTMWNINDGYASFDQIEVKPRPSGSVDIRQMWFLAPTIPGTSSDHMRYGIVDARSNVTIDRHINPNDDTIPVVLADFPVDGGPAATNGVAPGSTEKIWSTVDQRWVDPIDSLTGQSTSAGGTDSLQFSSITSVSDMPSIDEIAVEVTGRGAASDVGYSIDKIWFDESLGLCRVDFTETEANTSIEYDIEIQRRGR